MMHIIYKATHKQTGRVRYIGITHQELRRRIAGHRSNKKSLIYDDICRGLLEFEVIDTASDMVEALGKESYYITKYDTMFPNGANKVKSRRQIEGRESKEAAALDRQHQRLRKRGLMRDMPSLHMPVGSYYAQYRNQSLIDHITSYKDVRYMPYVRRMETQQHGIQKYYTPSVMMIAPVSSFFDNDDDAAMQKMAKRGIDFNLHQTMYQRFFYHERHKEWYGDSTEWSRRPLSDYVWDWIWDYTDKSNQQYLKMRAWDSCEVSFPHLWTSAPVLVADAYYYAITVEDYLNGR